MINKHLWLLSVFKTVLYFCGNWSILFFRIVWWTYLL